MTLYDAFLFAALAFVVGVYLGFRAKTVYSEPVTPFPAQPPPNVPKAAPRPESGTSRPAAEDHCPPLPDPARPRPLAIPVCSPVPGGFRISGYMAPQAAAHALNHPHGGPNHDGH